MFSKKNFLFINLFFALFLLFSCASRPSDKEVAQFAIDINNGNIEAVRSTLKKNKQLLYIGTEVMNGDTYYPIHFAINANNTEMVKLIANKKNVNFLNNENTYSPLFWAIAGRKHIEIIDILINVGADVNATVKSDGQNIFHIFAQNRNIKVWNLIKPYVTLKKINEPDNDSIVPIFSLILYQIYYSELDAPDAIALLKEYIELGANPNYLINKMDYAMEIMMHINENSFNEYKQVLLEGMKNNPPVGDSEKLIELLEKGK